MDGRLCKNKESVVSPNQQIHMGNFHVTLLNSGELLIHVWPANALVISRSAYKDSRSARIKRVYPIPKSKGDRRAKDGG